MFSKIPAFQNELNEQRKRTRCQQARAAVRVRVTVRQRLACPGSERTNISSPWPDSTAG